jgi:SAM-dependent methyltransferase
VTPVDARTRLYPERRFGGFSNRNGTVAFYTRVGALARPDSRVLDYGCGVGAHVNAEEPFVGSLQRLKGRVAEVIGVDMDGDAASNPYIDRFAPTAGREIPLEASSVDLCVSDWGLEHFDDPSSFFREAFRVLAPGGCLCLRTPNLLHYSSLGAWMLPFRFHHTVRRMLGYFHTEADVFPTLYRCNTRGRLQRALERERFDACVYRHRGESHTIGAGYAAGLVGEMIERLSPPLFSHELHAFARKPAS